MVTETLQRFYLLAESGERSDYPRLVVSGYQCGGIGYRLVHFAILPTKLAMGQLS